MSESLRFTRRRIAVRNDDTGTTMAIVDGWVLRVSERHLGALLHESSLASTMPTDRILTCRCDTTLVGRGRSSDSRSHSRGRPHSPERLEFPILSLHPGLRQRCVAPEPLAVRYRPFNRAHCLPECRRNRAGRERPGHTPSVRPIHLATHRVAHLRRRWRYCMGECEAVGWGCCSPRNRVTLEHDLTPVGG